MIGPDRWAVMFIPFSVLSVCVIGVKRLAHPNKGHRDRHIALIVLLTPPRWSLLRPAAADFTASSQRCQLMGFRWSRKTRHSTLRFG